MYTRLGEETEGVMPSVMDPSYPRTETISFVLRSLRTPQMQSLARGRGGRHHKLVPYGDF